MKRGLDSVVMDGEPQWRRGEPAVDPSLASPLWRGHGWRRRRDALARTRALPDDVFSGRRRADPLSVGPATDPPEPAIDRRNQMGLLDGKTALIFGVANDHSIAWGIARALHEEGATVGFSSVESLIERRVRPLAE